MGRGDEGDGRNGRRERIPPPLPPPKNNQRTIGIPPLNTRRVTSATSSFPTTTHGMNCRHNTYEHWIECLSKLDFQFLHQQLGQRGSSNGPAFDAAVTDLVAMGLKQGHEPPRKRPRPCLVVQTPEEED